MKALSFLGTGNYQETTYVFRGEECRTHLFPKALCEFFRPSDLLVFVTEEAEA
ncbi:MAG: TIGR02221 family CRISPR-associated protein, partial [Anaerolineae bacterium]|nr:TIGR02221 family CRISPR-associated protein [Anaerolineae bacterium]